MTTHRTSHSPHDGTIFEALAQHPDRPERYLLTLFVTGSTPRSTTAIGNIRALCEEFLADRYQLKIVDIYQQPATARHEQIVAAPTLVKHAPQPVRRLVGDLSQRDLVLRALSIRRLDPTDGPAGSSEPKP
ncbi:MAG TPA: circadian clock KaiB family protein [Opitutus sp.]|nr:circadian clock KaiB family protein [Opitutus sp.]